MAEYWFTCPRCHIMGAVDADQAEGRISIQCPTATCDYHATGKVRPLIPTSTPTQPKLAPSELEL